ncbi:MAG: hypothetical protein ACYCVZ_05070 [Streptosporangiaceae bacterium]
MRTIRHPSPLPPDPPPTGSVSPLPAKLVVSAAGSPLPPDPPIAMTGDMSPA